MKVRTAGPLVEVLVKVKVFTAELLPTGVSEKVSEAGEIDKFDCTAVPDKVKVVFAGVVLAVIVKVVFLIPILVGVKKGVKKHVPAGGIGPLKQLLSTSTAQLVASTPPKEEKSKLALPVLVIVTTVPVELELTDVFPNVILACDRLTAGAGAVIPVPVKLIVRVPLAALLGRFKIADSPPTIVGANLLLTVQFCALAKVVPLAQVPVPAKGKSGGLVPVIESNPRVTDNVPVFVIVVRCIAEVLPVTIDPKSKDVGVALSILVPVAAKSNTPSEGGLVRVTWIISKEGTQGENPPVAQEVVPVPTALLGEAN